MGPARRNDQSQDMAAQIPSLAVVKINRGRTTITGLGYLLIAVAVWNGHASGEQSLKGSTEGSRKNAVLVLEENVVRYTNEERIRRELPPLRLSPALQWLARRHSENMCRVKIFQHDSEAFPKGWTEFFGRLNLVGLRYGGENIGYRTLTGDPVKWAREMVHGWMKSPDHRKNILDRDFRFLGVGISTCANKLGYATQDFSSNPGRVPQNHARE